MSSYLGYKNVLIKSNEGTIYIKNIPKSIKRLDVMEKARKELAPHKEKLENIKYISNLDNSDIELKGIKIIEYKPPYYMQRYKEACDEFKYK